MNPVLTVQDMAAPGRVSAPGGLTFTVSPGEIVVLLGASGTGKSTILEYTAGLGPEHTGRITRPSTGMGVHFQEPRLLPWLDVLRNTLFPLRTREERHHRTAEAKAILTALGIRRFSADPTELSGGQRSRVSLARAILSAGTLLLADEPFAHLDTASADLVQQVLERRAADGCAVLLAAHEPERVASLGAKIIRLGE